LFLGIKSNSECTLEIYAHPKKKLKKIEHEGFDFDGPVKINPRYKDIDAEPFDYTDSYYAEAMNY
tara:strand:+ start:658 stop:852 length:195 start_codon:yes stop_codon:yes gene_type:complete